jgi:hypothetical protein
LVHAYLTDVRAALAAMEPAEREDVLVMVAEHIETSLEAAGPSPTAQDVQGVLKSLGPPQQWGDELDHRPRAAPTAPTPAWPEWIGTATLFAGAISVPLVFLQPFAAAALAILAICFGLSGARAHRGTHRRRYQAGAALGGLAVVLLIVLGVTLLDSGRGTAVPDAPAPVSGPPTQ